MQPSSSHSPFFSIVIPTKNRSFLVGNAIQSTLQQSFPDLEVVIADNDDTDATGKVVKSFSDARVKYLRTGNLSMPDNWEAGCALAQGEYLCVLEDKQVLKRRALERVFTELELNPSTSVKWKCDTFADSDSPPRLRLSKGDGKARMLTCDSLLDSFLNDLNSNYKSTLPLVQRGCIHRQLIKQIKAGPMKRLCHAVTPDVILSFLQLAYGETVLDIQDALAVYASDKHSNGRSIALKGALGRQFTRELGGKNLIYYDRTPIKAVTVPGIIFNDYVKTQEIVQGRLASHPVNWWKYFVECHSAIVGSQGMGVDMSEEMKAWKTALQQQSEKVRLEVKATLAANGQDERMRAGLVMKRLGKALGLPKLERVCKSIIRGKLQRDVEWRFGNVMEYLDWEDAHVGKH